MKHLNIFVKGKVQGVWFRKNTKLKADELALKGFVRNKKNGDVYIEIEGIEDQLQKFIAWCKVGPELAKVSGLEISEGDLVSFSSFEIKYN